MAEVKDKWIILKVIWEKQSLTRKFAQDTDNGLISKIHKQHIQLKETEKPNQKLAEVNQTFLQRNTGQPAHGKTRIVANYQRNASQNNSEGLSHAGQNG